jgi:hypothetical protein
MATSFVRSAEQRRTTASQSAKVEAATRSPAESREASRAERIKAAREQKKAEMAMQKKGGARATIRNEGDLVERKPLTPWEQLAQALLFTNEIAYVN